MKKFYFKSSLLTLLLSGFAFGQGSENFENIPTNTPSSYGNREWIGNDNVTWTATSARTDQTINGKAIATNDNGSVKSPLYAGGVGTLKFNYSRAFTGTKNRTIDVYVNNAKIGSTIIVDPNSNNIAEYNNEINIEGDVFIELRTSGTQIKIDDISWTGYKKVTNQPPVVSSKTITGTYGVLLTDGNITATNNPTSWTQTGILPTGISFDKGVFSGTPTQAGSFIAQVTATNDYGTSDAANVTFEIAKANQTVNYTFEDLTQNRGTTFSSLPAQTDQGQNIVYTSADNSIVSANGNTLSFDGIGSTTITATSIGVNNFNEYTTTFNVKSNDPNATYCFEETFDGLEGNNTDGNGSAKLWNGNDNFVSTIQAYQAGDAVKLGTSKLNGSITSKALDQISGNVTVSFDVKGWSSVEGSMNITLGSETKNVIYTAKMADAFENVTVSFENVAAGSTLKLETSAKRAFIDNVRIQCASSNNSTTWDGTAWSNGTPDLTKDVIIKGEVTIDTQFEAKTLTVSDAGGSVIVKSGGNLIVDGKIDNQAGLTGLIVENGANLIQNQNVANSGAITVNRDSKSMVRNDMTFWSSPVQQEAWQQTIRSFSPETLYNRFWTYNETSDEFNQILTSDADSKLFEAGKGISIRVKNTLPTGQTTIHNGSFLGVPFNGDVAVPVQFTANGYNLVGNPYASNINVEKFLAENTNVNSLYFWTHQFPVGSSEYANNYAAFNVVGSVIPGLTNISVGQGFIVGLSQATPTVNFNNTMRTAQDASFYKNTIAEKNRIWLSLSKENKTISQILLAYMDGATNDVDNQIDAKVMQRGSSAIYSLINNEAYAIQGRSLPFKTDDVVKLGFEALEQGNYTINIEQVDGLFENDQIIYLKDKELNKIINLSESAYSFASNLGIFNDRFELVYVEKTLATDDLSKNDIVIYNANNTIVIDAKQNKIVAIELYDIQGRKVFGKENINASSYKVQSSAKGVLVIKVLTEDGKVKTQKIVNK
ncbi:T9SS type A sorting domain-containing protein [Empedobacter tilapiae]